MKNKVLMLMLVILSIFMFTACSKKEKSDPVKFKENYESLNGKSTSYGKKYRSITIDEDNPFVITTMDKVIKMMDKKESFVVYFGANWCPWCRSVIPTFIKTAKEMNVKKVYYVDVRPDNDETKDIRDIYLLDKNGEIYLSHKGLDSYHDFIKRADSLLSEYSSHDVSVKDTKFAGQKRVGAPSFIVIKNGQATYLTTGVSSMQKDPFMKLNSKINNDVKSKFKKLFNEYNK